MAGLKVAIEVHTEDDHAKNSHQCESTYTLKIVLPDGTSTSNQMYSVIDDWGRSIRFSIDGFASHGHKAIATTVEGKSFQLLVYDLDQTGRAPDVYVIPQGFLRTLSGSCRDSLKAAGLTQDGNPVFRTEGSACNETSGTWEMKHERRKPAHDLGAGEPNHDRVLPLRNHAVFEPLDPGHVPST